MQRLLTNSHELQDFNHFYRIFMGYGLPIKSYKLFKNRVHLTKAANVLMKYRLCDIMAWALCNDKSGPVPLHKRRVFKVLQRTVSFLPYSKSINTYYSFKTFHSMSSYCWATYSAWNPRTLLGIFLAFLASARNVQRTVKMADKLPMHSQCTPNPSTRMEVGILGILPIGMT